MNNIPFVIWLLLWPLVTSGCSYIDCKREPEWYKQYSIFARVFTGLIELAIWVIVAYLLYHR